MKEQFNAHASELLVDLSEKIAYSLHKKMGISAGKADEIGIEISQQIARDWGGQIIYFTKNCQFLISEKHLAIYREFTGHNHRELAKKWNLTVPAIYRIVARIGRQERAKHQPDLFSQ